MIKGNLSPMIISKLGVSLALVLVFASHSAAQVDISGTWQGRYMFTDITAHVDDMNESISGFVIVHEGRNDSVYHFTGTLKGNAIQASHHDGYVFTGRLTSDARIVGTLSTKNNVTIQLTMMRASQQDSGK